jgi:hypothetical protein
MDALALLCNLYGDGPATLARLRSAGCDSFERLEQMEAHVLAGVLGATEAAARRFQREAGVLVERIRERALEEEERPPLVTTTLEPWALEATSSAPASPGALDTAEDSEENPAAPLIERVLQSWRERDATVGAEHDVEFSEVDEVVPTSQLAAEDVAVGTPLRPRIVDGLDRSWCERLRAAGVATVEELAEAEALALSEKSGAGLTQIMRIQFLARRLISERGLAETPEPPDVLKPVGRHGPAARRRFAEPEPALPAKFSHAETPFGVAAAPLSRELDETFEAPAPRPPELSGGDEGTAGPFA